MKKKVPVTLSVLILLIGGCVAFMIIVFYRLGGVSATKPKEQVDENIHVISEQTTDVDENIHTIAEIQDKIFYDDTGILCSDNLSGTVISIAIGSNVFAIDLSYTCVSYDALEMYTDKPMSIKIPVGSEYYFYINGEQVNDNSQIIIDNLGKNIRLQLTIAKGADIRQYQIKTMPDNFPSIQMMGKSSEPGDYYGDFLKGAGEQSFIYRMSNEGDITYIQASNRGSIYNFEKWNIDNKTYYSYFQEQIEYNNISSITASYSQGYFIVMDENFTIIDKVSVIEDEEKKVVKGYAEAHDFIMLGEGHYITLAYIPRTPNPEHYQDSISSGTKVLATYLQETQEGKILWSWLSTDFPEFYTYSVEENDYSNSSLMLADYMHTNSIDIDPRDHNIVVSSRHQDSIYKIDKETGDLIWILGGTGDMFELSADQLFSHQHDAQILPDGCLILFDNNNSKGVSRIIQMKLDEDKHVIDDYIDFTTGEFSIACGCVTKFDENIFGIGWGFAYDTNCIYSEVDIATNTVLMQLVIDGNTSVTYRTRKF